MIGKALFSAASIASMASAEGSQEYYGYTPKVMDSNWANAGNWGWSDFVVGGIIGAYDGFQYNAYDSSCSSEWFYFSISLLQNSKYFDTGAPNKDVVTSILFGLNVLGQVANSAELIARCNAQYELTKTPEGAWYKDYNLIAIDSLQK